LAGNSVGVQKDCLSAAPFPDGNQLTEEVRGGKRQEKTIQAGNPLFRNVYISFQVK
jgi:hypothetical protein